MLAAGLVLAMSLAAVYGWALHRSRTAALPGTTPVAADMRQSGIVLPFENNSGDPGQDGLAESITNTVTDLIARSGDMPAVPEATAASYRGKPLDLHQIGRKFGVHFAIIGSAHRQEGHLIVSVAVYDISTGRSVFGRLLDRPDGPRAIAEIAQIIYESYWQMSLDVEVAYALRTHPDHMDARDLIMESRSTPLETLTKAHYLERASLVDRALALDPDNLIGLEQRSRAHAEMILLGFSDDPKTDLAIARQASDRMMDIGPNKMMTLRARSKVLRAEGNWQEAERVQRRVINLQPTEGNRWLELGNILMAEGRHAEALASFENAKAFAGGGDNVYLIDAWIATAELAQGMLPEAIGTAHLSLSEFPSHSGRLGEIPWLTLIAAEADSGQDSAAKTDLQAYLATQRTWRSVEPVGKWPTLATNRNLLDGLRKAGLPAE